MDVELTAEFSCGGELSNQDFQIVTGHAVCVSVQGKPGTANGIVDGNVASRETAAGLERREPGIASGLNRAHVGLPHHSVGGSLQSDGHPRVVSEVRIDREEQAVDAIGHPTAEQGVVKICRGAQHRGVDGVTGNRGHEVRAVDRRGIDAGGAVPGQVCCAKGADQQADVFRHRFNFNAVLLGVKGEGKRKGEEQSECCCRQAESMEHGDKMRRVNSVICSESRMTLTNFSWTSMNGF